MQHGSAPNRRRASATYCANAMAADIHAELLRFMRESFTVDHIIIGRFLAGLDAYVPVSPSYDRLHAFLEEIQSNFFRQESRRDQIRDQVLGCFPALSEVLHLSLLEVLQKATVLKAQNERTVSDCRSALFSIQSSNADSIVQKLRVPQVWQIAKRVALSLKEDEITHSDLFGPRSIFNQIAAKFRSRLQDRMLNTYGPDSIEADRTKHMSTLQLVACFPDLLPVMLELRSRIKAAFESVEPDVMRQPKELLVVADLDLSYRSYIVVKRCYDMRKGYLAVFISDPEMAQARDAVGVIEKKLAPQLDSGHFTLDKLWKDADQGVSAEWGAMLGVCRMDAGHNCRPICQQELSKLLAIRARILPGSGGTKKDF
jgi:hypothetical protein